MKKKNRTWRAAALLLVLTLITSCFVGGTFAKYTTSDTASDTARVAKFGVTVEADGTLFSKTYKNVPETDEGTITVKSSSTDEVVAPGTKNGGNGLEFSVTGTPEVDVNVTSTLKAKNIYLIQGKYAKMVKVNLTETTYEKGKYYTKDADGKFTVSADDYAASKDYYVKQADIAVAADYYPVQYKLAGKDNTTGSSTTPSVAIDTLLNETNGVAAKIADDLDLGTVTLDATTNITTYNNASGKLVKANNDLAETLKLANETVTWEWKFEETKDDDTNYDPEDTILGDLMAYTDASDYVIVLVEVTDGSETYTALTVDGNKLVKKANGTDIIASLETVFELTITVTQVD